MNTPVLLPAASSRSLILLAIAVFLVMAVAFMGSSATQPHITGWYATLKKPAFNPPNWVFPIVWPALFALMAFGFWRILRAVESGQARRTAILTFIIQLVVNVAWSFAFFGANSPGAGLVVAVFLVIAVAAMVIAFRKVDPLSAALQVPYLGWVTFALILNATIWWIN